MCNNIIISFQPFLYHFEVVFLLCIFRTSNGSCCLICTSLHFALCAPYSTHLPQEKCVAAAAEQMNSVRVCPSGEDALVLSRSIFLWCSKVAGQQSTVHSTSVLQWRLGMEIVFSWKKQSFILHLVTKVLQLRWLVIILATSLFPQPDDGSRWIFRRSWYTFSLFPIC